MSYRYILRYFIDPAYSPDERLCELSHFCRTANVEEVMLFITPEELSPGYPTEAEISSYITLAQKAKRALAQGGVSLSLNPWSALYSVPRGRKLRGGQNFRLMVGETGVFSPIVPCPLCDIWQEDLCRSFARMASEVAPTVIWIEDDWRLHNHGSELGWGGCFCESHLALFSRRVGKDVQLVELLETILQPGPPHPWRAEWMALSRETLLAPLRRLSTSVQAANPSTNLGLMTSMPDQHSIEGRDWAALESIFGGAGIFRPHMPPYTQERALRMTSSITRQTIACLSESAEIYPELENSPRSGIYSKSGTYTVWQMLEAALLGSHGITINHFDMMGNGTSLDPKFGSFLAEAKPLLNAIGDLRLDDRSAHGVQILFSPKIASHLYLEGSSTGLTSGNRELAMKMQDPSYSGGGTGEGCTLQRLAHPSIIWGDVCAIFGIAHRFTQKIEPGKGPILVSGQTLRAFRPDEIDTLLSGRVFLDAEAAMMLFQEGRGRDIGLVGASWKTLEETAYSYEEVLEHPIGIPTSARMTAQRCSECLLALVPDSSSRLLTQIYNAERLPLWPGAYTFSSPQGGVVTVLCYPLNGGSQFFVGFFNVYRQRLLANLIMEGPGHQLVVKDGLRCYSHTAEGGTIIAVLNPTDDSVDEINFISSSRLGRRWLSLDMAGHWQTCEGRTKASGNVFEISLHEELAPLKVKIFKSEQMPQAFDIL